VKAPNLFVRLFFPSRLRAWCIGEGLHKPVLVDCGMDKRCLNCGCR
jgi:hypothetical protein